MAATLGELPESFFGLHGPELDRFKRINSSEAVIDAFSYHQLEPDDRTHYVSTNGAFGERQATHVATAIARMPVGATIVIATDKDEAGEKMYAFDWPNYTWRLIADRSNYGGSPDRPYSLARSIGSRCGRQREQRRSWRRWRPWPPGPLRRSP
jgi:hypothetical protein